jgi:hypothetical protein
MLMVRVGYSCAAAAATNKTDRQPARSLFNMFPPVDLCASRRMTLGSGKGFDPRQL